MIFFDLDNTLVDHSKASLIAVAELYKAFKDGLSFSEAEANSLWLKITRKYYDLYLTKKISYKKKDYFCIKEFFQLGDSANKLEHKIDDGVKLYAYHYEANWSLFDDVIPTLEIFKDRPLGIITNGIYNEQRRKLRKLEIDKYFKVIISFSRIGTAKSKTNCEIFLKACAAIGKCPEECWHIGDDFVKDVVSASKAGMKAVWLNRNNASCEQESFHPIYCIDILTQLSAVINR